MKLSTTSQRQSLMLYFKPVNAPEPRKLYAPARHRAMLERIYTGLGAACEWCEAPGERADGPGELAIGLDAGAHTGTITVGRIGADTPAAARQALDDLLERGRLGAAYVELPLSDPSAPSLCEAFEAAGCYFAGVGPLMLNGGDALRLQHVATPLDLSKLSVFSPFGQELLAYIGSERDRTRRS